MCVCVCVCVFNISRESAHAIKEAKKFHSPSSAGGNPGKSSVEF